MRSASGKYVIVFNGEVYNFGALRQELETFGHSFRGHSDTEVMLASFEEWGVEGAVKRFVGMFAFALWDHEARRLYLVRDRLGIKPLYYGWANKVFLFGSELKAVRAHPYFCGEIDRDSLALFMRHNYIPSPYSIYKGVCKLLPGAILCIDSDGAIHQSQYWSAKDVAEQGFAHPFSGTMEEACGQLEVLLKEVVGLRMISDVPLGAFLSGGIDSSAVVALMQSQSTRPVKTFTIGFHESFYNEAEYAKAVASHLGTEHTELYVTPEETMAVIPQLPTLYDEPFADASQIPTYLVSQLARQHVTVSLSGDGGDELFAGYDRYALGRSVWKNIGWSPKWSRKLLSRGLTSFSPQALDRFLHPLMPILPQTAGSHPGGRLLRLAEILPEDTPELMYFGLVSHFKQPTSLVIDSVEPPTTMANPDLWARVPDLTHRMMYADAVAYLPDDILTKVDRASMGVSLEARVPLLDHRVFAYAWQLPLSMKVQHNKGKWILRQVLYRYVPPALVERPKKGFGVPIDRWLRGPLRDWAASLLESGRIQQEGYLRSEPIQKIWNEHLSHKRDWEYYLWNILMFQAWLENN
jgi:asparagine synthase (glutamine-hydrolysing)